MLAIGLGLMLGLIILLASSLKVVPHQERWLIELLGKYFTTYKPGLKIIIPKIMKQRAIVDLREQAIPLFEVPIKIDFTDGSATPKRAKVFIRVKNPDTPYDAGDGKELMGAYRATYEIADVKESIKTTIENAARSYLNGLTIDVGLTQRGAGFDLKNKFPGDEIRRLDETLAKWGFEFYRVSVEDFDLEPDLVRARGEIQKRKRAADAAIEEAKIRARENIGALIEMIALGTGKSTQYIQSLIEANPDLMGKLHSFSEDLITRRMSLDGKAMIDIRSGGGGELEQGILRLIAPFIETGKTEERSGKTGKKEKKEED